MSTARVEVIVTAPECWIWADSRLVSLIIPSSLSDALGDGRMSSALLNGARRALAQRARTASARSFNTSAPKRGGGGGDEPVREATRGPGPLDIF